MIPVAEAEGKVLESLRPLSAVVCALADAAGRILRERVRADRPAPPYDRVMMDGAALSFAAWAAGCRRFQIQTTVPAGRPPPRLADVSFAIEVMTGGVLPAGCDWVAPREWCRRSGDKLDVLPPADERPAPGLFVHAAGSDGPAGRVVLEPGLRLGPCEQAIAATEGRTALKTGPVPRIRLITTGDEVVPPDAEPQPWQIRGSHAVALQALFAGFGSCDWRAVHAQDREAELDTAIRAGLADADLLLVAGGVSRGDWDFVPGRLVAAGVEPRFHWVAQRPGKPLWYGVRGNVPVFGLPGNPLAALFTARRYARPALDRLLGAHPAETPRRPVDRPLPAQASFTTFHAVREAGERLELLPASNSGDLHSLAGSDGFVECPPSHQPWPPGKPVSFYAWQR